MSERARARRAKKYIQKLERQGTVVDLCTTYIKASTLNPDTNSQVEDCYAKELGSCDGGISREHYISRAVLEQFEYIEAQGIPWIGTEGLRLSPEALTTKCLCRYHNSHLSPLDDLMGKSFTKILHFLGASAEIVIIDGTAFERAMLKHLLGLLGTERIENAGRRYGPSDIDPQWVKYLFAQESFPDNIGLFIFHPVGSRVVSQKRLQLAPLYIENEIQGLHASINGFDFYLCMVSKEVGFRTNHPQYNQILHRPRQLQKEEGAGKIIFHWD